MNTIFMNSENSKTFDMNYYSNFKIKQTLKGVINMLLSEIILYTVNQYDHTILSFLFNMFLFKLFQLLNLNAIFI